MLDTLSAIATHPLTWIFAAGCGVFFLIQSVVASTPKKRIGPDATWFARNYVWVVLGIASVLAVMALSFYLVETAMSVSALVDRLRDEVADPDARTPDLRNLAYAVAVLLGVLAAAATILFSLIKVWINERQTSAAEQGLITDRINKAVEALGAEKEVNRLGRNITYTLNKRVIRELEWRDGPGLPDSAILGPDPTGDWKNYALTEPNLEVRIGAILALERISQDSLRDHIQIMEILTAYIRENAPATDLSPTENFEKPAVPRSDIQLAIRVLGRRSVVGKEMEADQEFRLDLRNCDLSGVHFSDGDFSGAMFDKCRLEGCSLRRSRFHGTAFFGSLLNHSDLRNTDLTGARLDHAKINRSTKEKSTACSFLSSTVTGMCVFGADLRAVRNFGKLETRNFIFGDSTTQLNDYYKAEVRREGVENLHRQLAVLKAGKQVYSIATKASYLSRMGTPLHEPTTEEVKMKLMELGWRHWFFASLKQRDLERNYSSYCFQNGLVGYPYQVRR